MAVSGWVASGAISFEATVSNSCRPYFYTFFEFYYFKYAVLEKLKSEVFNVMFWLFCHLQSVILSCLECPAR